MNATFQPMRPLPFEEAAKFFGDKVVLTPQEFAELRDDAKSQAFSVAGLARLDAVTDVFNAMYRAVEFGTSFSTFKADIRDIIERKGWTGKAAWRVDTIFRTNIQTAYRREPPFRPEEVAEMTLAISPGTGAAYVTFLAGLVGTEVLAQAEAAAARRIKTADFDDPWTFDSFDWTSA
jgi:hypothetical protein